ncbi:phaC PHA synthase, partial [Vibrio cholerae]
MEVIFMNKPFALMALTAAMAA